MACRASSAVHLLIHVPHAPALPNLAASSCEKNSNRRRDAGAALRLATGANHAKAGQPATVLAQGEVANVEGEAPTSRPITSRLRVSVLPAHDSPGRRRSRPRPHRAR